MISVKTKVLTKVYMKYRWQKYYSEIRDNTGMDGTNIFLEIYCRITEECQLQKLFIEITKVVSVSTEITVKKN